MSIKRKAKKKTKTILSYLFPKLILSYDFAKANSYFPELTHKKQYQKYKYFRNSLRHNNCLGYFYYLYGFDCLNFRNEKDYVTENDFWSAADKLNGSLQNHSVCLPGSQLFLLRDKFEFFHYMKRNNIATPPVFGLLHNNEFFDVNLNPVPNSYFDKYKDIFIKDLCGQCGSFVKHLDNIDQLDTIHVNKNEYYVIQEKVNQHNLLNKLNPTSINTLRIVTVYNNGNPVIFSSIIRIGTLRSGCVDNWACGGIAIGIDNNGKLKEYGFYKSAELGKTDKHPDTNVVFLSYSIPFYKEACQLCIETHKKFYRVHSIGWDVAITENGPTIIEGNDNWEISLMQAANGGLKAKFDLYFK